MSYTVGQMITVCLEGPSAVGKSSIARFFVENGDAIAIPEVNQLLQRPINAGTEWYLQQQLERWAMASGSSKEKSLVIFDGDVLQPLWYGWAYQFSNHSSCSELLAFYRPLFANGKLTFPDVYFLMECSVEELRSRKTQDATRSRRNFEQHLELIEPQKRYFEALQKLIPSLVHWIPMNSVEGAAATIRRLVPRQSRSKSGDLEAFDQLVMLFN